MSNLGEKHVSHSAAEAVNRFMGGAVADVQCRTTNCFQGTPSALATYFGMIIGRPTGTSTRVHRTDSS
jgi:hypothetical protein